MIQDTKIFKAYFAKKLLQAMELSVFCWSTVFMFNKKLCKMTLAVITAGGGNLLYGLICG